MQEKWETICGVPTRIYRWDKSLDKESFKKKDIVLCITGNPGLAGFYTIFLSALYRFLSDTPVWCIGIYFFDSYQNDLVLKKMLNYRTCWP